ncbi:hypothetical protein CAEBREN_06551 [Caenorhabditis brenneri]|uniref:Glutaredoxin-related protein 5, mitochondrial n=1 Tax=Caenorhabditis brenneri TaxID=135651 RepID=G0P7N2_CAEBE|nr:hypothetical protein CAEBREN_06551 [Caenorhabditis brenneri]
MLRLVSRQAFSVLRSNYSSAAAAGGGGLSDEMRKKIDGIVKKDDVVVFMKGTQQEPACGFSRNVKLVLDFHNVKFQDYNVLTDPELREGVKVYSEWPTIPQVYVKGEFVGGCDILISMHKDGEISDFLDNKGVPNKYGSK